MLSVTFTMKSSNYITLHIAIWHTVMYLLFYFRFIKMFCIFKLKKYIHTVVKKNKKKITRISLDGFVYISNIWRTAKWQNNSKYKWMLFFCITYYSPFGRNNEVMVMCGPVFKGLLSGELYILRFINVIQVRTDVCLCFKYVFCCKKSY